MQEIYCRYAPSLGALEGTPEEVWGTPPYDPEKHIDKPCVFFGLYGLPDFYSLWRHKGKKWILWAGSDITHFENGYWLDDKGEIKIKKGALAEWINENCDNWVENNSQSNRLNRVKIKNVRVQCSFMGDINNFDFSFKKGNNAYLSCSGGLVEEYGFTIIERIAGRLPNIVFHLYGADWKTKHKNVMVHGRVPKEQMNEEIKNYQLALRFNKSDGFSEILAKAVLMEQYAIGKVRHPYIPTFNSDSDLIMKIKREISKSKPNSKVALWYQQNLNRFPWNVKKT